jgi:peptide/nickel transport system permease protein
VLKGVTSDFAWFAARRIAGAVAVLLVVSFLIFSCLYIAPGSPEQAIIGPNQATPEALEEVRIQYHLNEPFFDQYWRFLKGLATLNFGRSFQTGQEVNAGITERLGVTIPLGLGGFLVASLFGIGGGILAARKRGKPVDRGLVGSSIVAASAPAYATGFLLLYLFGVLLAWLPVSGAGNGIGDRATHLILPVITLGLVGAAPILRITRVAMTQALERDDVAFARARGVSATTILFRYSLRHALVMIATVCGIVLIYMLVATAVVETTFSLNGVGSYLITSITKKDLPAVQGVAMVATFIVVVINLGLDLLYAVIDPRIQHGYAAT